jgi:alkanesulfonate monooxygenase SsuD/methylene tetrahydromethanopterin reductase-like flavin-dependent oxidoreductase (luciferase family)
VEPGGPHPWVAERKAEVRFAVQGFPLAEDRDPTSTILAAGIAAEEVGLDGFFIGDHPGYHIEPWLHLSALAAQTSRIQLGSVVNCIFHRHPSMLARMTADLDRISNGRLMLGVGIGWNEPEFAQLGLPFPSVPARQDALDEALEIITGMFGPEPVSFRGEHWWVERAHITAPPVQLPYPPILIAGAGKQTLRQVARWADISNFGNSRNTGNVQDDEQVKAKFRTIDDALRDAGRSPESLLRSHFTSWLMLAETDAAAKAKLDRYYPDGLNEEQQRTRIYGTPEAAIAYYRAQRELGFEYFVVQIQDASDLETIRLLGEAVAPAFA